MSAAHTPGPWDLYGMTADGCKIAATDVPFTHVATVQPMLPQFLAESVANARLIASAPELLSALKDMVCRASPVLESNCAELPNGYAVPTGLTDWKTRSALPAPPLPKRRRCNHEQRIRIATGAR